MDDAKLVAAVRVDLARIMSLTAAPTATLVQRWPRAIPQYLVGHKDRVAAVRAAVAEVPGLEMAGAAFDGVGVPACIRDASRAVTALLG